MTIYPQRPPAGRVEFYFPEDDEGNRDQVILRTWDRLSADSRAKATHWRPFISPKNQSDMDRYQENMKTAEDIMRSNDPGSALMDAILGRRK